LNRLSAKVVDPIRVEVKTGATILRADGRVLEIKPDGVVEAIRVHVKDGTSIRVLEIKPDAKALRVEVKDGKTILRADGKVRVLEVKPQDVKPIRVEVKVSPTIIRTKSGEGRVIAIKPVIVDTGVTLVAVKPVIVDTAVSPVEVKPVIILRVDGDGLPKASSDEKEKEKRRKLIR
jgi:hypothetical protein